MPHDVYYIENTPNYETFWGFVKIKGLWFS